MSRVPTVRAADLARTLAALKACGFGPARVELQPGGGIVITPGPLTAGGAGVTPAEPVDDLTVWRRKKHGRHAAQGT